MTLITAWISGGRGDEMPSSRLLMMSGIVAQSLDMGEFAHLITEKDVELYASDYAIEMEKLVPLYEIRDDLDTVSPWCLDRYLKTAIQGEDGKEECKAG